MRGLKVAAVKAPGFGGRRKVILEGIAVLTSGQEISEDFGVKLENVTLDKLGGAKRVTVVDAVSEGRFHIYPVETIDQGLEILTGVAAGTRGPDGRFPEGTVNHKIEASLTALAEKRRAFGRMGGDTGPSRASMRGA